MRIGQPSVYRPHRHFDSKGSKEGEPQPLLQAGRKGVGQGDGNIGSSGLEIHCNQGEQHQNRAEQGVKKKLKCRINSIWTAPNSDNQEHWYQHAFKEHVEKDKIECTEYADHKCLQDKEGDHEFLNLKLDHLPGRDDREQSQKSREQDKEQRDAVDTHVVGKLEPPEGDPVRALDEL